MRIEKDLNNRINEQRVANVNVSKNLSSRNTTLSTQNQHNQQGSTRAAKKAAIESMILAQISNDILREAMITSARLKNLSADSLNNGSINQSELNTILTNVGTGSSETGITSSIQTQHITVSQNIPEIKQNIEFIENTANTLKENPQVNAELVEKINKNHKEIETKSKELDVVQQKAETETYKLTGATQQKNEIPAEQLAKNTVNSISSIPHQALLSQGSLIPDMVSHLSK